MANHGRHDMQAKIDAAIAYIVTADSEAASKLCNVPGRTIREWMHSEWWGDVLEEAKLIKQKELDSTFTRIIHQATDQLIDRIEKGDVSIDKAGNRQYVPVKAKDLAWIAAIITDKRALARGQPTSRSERKVSVEEQLNKITTTFGEAGAKVLDEAG
jgi:hypothetical protein